MTSRISASSYSNTAPLVWSFLYGRNHGRVELILDNAPARSAELLRQDVVDAALVPVIAFHEIDGASLIPDVCVGARERVRSVCLVTKGEDLGAVRSISLDISSRTSVVLTKVIFREFIGSEPTWRDAPPNVESMLADSDAALIIGDPALRLSSAASGSFRVFDMAELWRQYTGLGFVFAMWMTRRGTSPIDFAAARDEGLAHTSDIAANYADEIGLAEDEMTDYLTHSISYTPTEEMLSGMRLYFELAAKHKLLTQPRPLSFI